MDAACILDCTVVLEPGEDRHQLICTPCHTLRPITVPSPCSTRQIPWLPMDLLVLVFLLGKHWPWGRTAYPHCWELRWFRDPSLRGGCWAAEMVAMAMLPAWQRPQPDCCKIQRGIQAALSSVGISKRLTWLLTPRGTSQHPGAAQAPRSTGGPAPSHPAPCPWSRGCGAAASTFPDHGASCCISGLGCRDGTGWDGWGWSGCMGEQGVLRHLSTAPSLCLHALCSRGTGGWGLAGARPEPRLRPWQLLPSHWEPAGGASLPPECHLHLWVGWAPGVLHRQPPPGEPTQPQNNSSTDPHSQALVQLPVTHP